MEHLLAKEGVAGSIPVSRSKKSILSDTFFLLFFGVLLYSPCLMYRRRRSCCLTLLPVSAPRPSSVIFLLSKGTDCHFPSPVPGRRLFYRFPRVQMTTFPLLYPADALFSASHGYRRPLFLSCTRPAPSSPQTAQKFDIWVKRLGSSYPSVSSKIRFSVSVGTSCFK